MKRRIVLSVLLVLLGGLYSLAMGIIASRSMWVLLAIVPILWAIASTSAREKNPRGKALLFGAILCACYVLIGTIVFYRDAARWLWWLPVLNVLVDIFIRPHKDSEEH